MSDNQLHFVSTKKSNIVNIQDLKLNCDDYDAYLKDEETIDGSDNSITLYDLIVRIIKQDHHKLPDNLNHHP